ncbi:MAG: glycosyltransferase [Proteobacteria bacterium]|nr:glycosyltransferase [Pseudomonadota bacterium]
MNVPVRTWLGPNIEALADSHPELARRLKAMGAPVRLEVIPARTGRPVLIKNRVSFHSRNDPDEEAARFARSPQAEAALEAGLTPIVFGFGLGYHVRALSAFFERLAIWEPDPEVLHAALSLFDWTDLAPRLTFLTTGDKTPDRLKARAALLIHRPTERLYPADCARLQRELEADPPSGPGTDTGSGMKIMLVTPLYGGSLPVARHAGRALTGLGHKVIEADMTGLDPIHQQVKKAAAPEERKDAVGRRLIALAGEYLAFLAEAERPDLVLALAQAPLDIRTLSRLRGLGIPSAFWFVEDGRLMSYFREVAPAYDFFFHIQGPDMDRELKRLGARSIHYLPLAADPACFRPIDDVDRLRRYRADLSFMGSGYPNRRRVFGELLSYDLKIWGTEWDLSTPLGARVQDRGRRIPTEETAAIFNAARINLNLHSSVFSTGLDPAGGFVNPRTFEIAACGAFQLVDRRRPIETHFDCEREMAVFDDPADLSRKIDFYLIRPELRRDMSLRARTRVLAEHTYTHRMRELVRQVGRAGG